MTDIDTSLLTLVVEAIDDDWAFTDKDDDDPYFVLVNESRNEHDSFKPEKMAIQLLEERGLIEFCTKRSDPKNKQREHMDFLDETLTVPFVYFYIVTDEGRRLAKPQALT